jgi:hypothetical protein
MIRETAKADFDARCPSYNAGVAPWLIEKKWFYDDVTATAGILIFDNADKDWSFVTLQPDDVGVYRAVDLGHSFETAQKAMAALYQSIAEEGRQPTVQQYRGPRATTLRHGAGNQGGRPPGLPGRRFGAIFTP